MDRRLSRLGTRDGNPQPRARNPPVIDSSSGSVHRSRRYNATSRRSLRTSIGGLSSIGSSSNSLITSMEPGSANTTRRSTSSSGISASSCSDSVSVRCVGRTRPTPASNASRLQRRTAPGAQPRLDRRSDRTAPIDVTGSVASTRSITIRSRRTKWVVFVSRTYRTHCRLTGRGTELAERGWKRVGQQRCCPVRDR